MRIAQLVVNMYQGMEDGDKYVLDDEEVEPELFSTFEFAL